MFLVYGFNHKMEIGKALADLTIIANVQKRFCIIKKVECKK
ncbi:hypothetical protein CLERM_400 [Coxiella-like endosymbiont]|nr:hypothetical protein CLERM_597 [Coxiella-like endosymbiont]PMB54984.1 hypothetical protein CLERM_400 [Coxiella-like endosymbiont]